VLRRIVEGETARPRLAGVAAREFLALRDP
jgi:hypothetical protein